jgi:hypothetical protein
LRPNWGVSFHDEALRGILDAGIYPGPLNLGRLLEGEMRNTVSKAIVAGVAALSLATAVVATTEPASAQQWHGGGFGGGWHGGGWNGGWRGGGWRGGGVWHPGYWNNGGWYGGWWGPAAVAGLAAGAIVTAPYWGGWGGGGCWQVRPVYSMNGVYLGNHQVNVCQ